MTASSPSPETIRFIARILAAQPTAIADVAETIANIVKHTLGKPDEVFVEVVTVPSCSYFSTGSPKHMEQVPAG